MKQLITDRTLRNLKPAPRGKRLVVWDTALPSFGVRITDKGKASCFVMRRRGGDTRLIRVGLGSYPAVGLAEARERARLAFAELAAGRVSPLRELRDSLSQMRAAGLSVGSDGRNRALLSAFGARTGRNQPSSTKFIFGPSVWLRGLIKPEPGMALAYIDWSSQEFGIAAALSGDKRMLEAYASGDPYLAFAKQAGAVPADATKQSHKRERDVFKTVLLGVGYGMEADALAGRLGILPVEARELLLKHRETYPRFWRWSQNVVDTAMAGHPLSTVFGWRLHAGPGPNPRSLRTSPCRRTAPKCCG